MWRPRAVQGAAAQGRALPNTNLWNRRNLLLKQKNWSYMDLQLQLLHLVMLYSKQQQCPEPMETLVDQ